MTLKNIIVSVTIIISLFAFSTKVIADPLEINPTDLTPQQQVEYFSMLYGGDSNLIKGVIDCESDGKHSSIGDGGLSNGIFQFQESTFDRIEKAFGEDLNYKSEFDQIKLGTWAISNGYGNEWTSYRAIKNGGRYSFYSKQLHKHFTVICKL